MVEQVSALLPVESFPALASARDFSARAGAVEFALSRQNQAALRHLAAKIASAAP